MKYVIERVEEGGEGGLVDADVLDAFAVGESIAGNVDGDVGHCQAVDVVEIEALVSSEMTVLNDDILHRHFGEAVEMSRTTR